jgi:predicted DNA-binding ribbon-helix-helix protein
MKSSIVKRSVVIDGHKTSVSLENAFWSDLKEIARAQETTLSNLLAKIDETRQHGNLCSAIRLFVLAHAIDSKTQTSALGTSSTFSPSIDDAVTT